MATTPFKLDLTIVKGISYGPVIFNFKQEDLTPFDLTDGGPWKVFSYAKKSPDSRQKIDLDPQITDAAGGVVQISKTDEQTLALLAGKYGWDLVLETPAGVRLGPYFAGDLLIKEIVTHA